MVAYDKSVTCTRFMPLCITSCCFQMVIKAGIEILILSNQRMLLFAESMSPRGVTLPSAFTHVPWNLQIYSEEAGSFNSIW